MIRLLCLLVLVVAPLPGLVPLASAQPGPPGFGQRPPLGDVGSLPEDWDPGRFDRRTGKWLAETSRNVKWVVPLGSQTFGSPIVASGKVFVGTNNGAGYLPQFLPHRMDLGCLLCFQEEDGEFLWQFSAEKLPTGRVHDWPMMGIQSTPWIEGDRGWFVSNRGEVICFDTEGFHDKEDDGEPHSDASILHLTPGSERTKWLADLDRAKLPLSLDLFIQGRWPLAKAEWRIDVGEPGKSWRLVEKTDQRRDPANSTPPRAFRLTLDFWGIRVAREGAKPDPKEADVVWRLNMMEQFGSQQHNYSICCPVVWKNMLFVCTGNGVDESHLHLPAPDAPSFVALDKSTGQVLWTSNLPGKNIHHGNWSSPVVGVIGGVPQVIFNGGDGWTYSFHAEEWKEGKPILLWKFDTNPKEAEYKLNGLGTRNEPIAPPVIHDGRIYVTVGQDAEHGDGPGCLWCIDPTKRGDISAELAVSVNDPQKIVPHERMRGVDPKKGQKTVPNPNSGVAWKYVGVDRNHNGKPEFEEEMHRSLTPVAITGDLLFCNDFGGVVHCLDLKSGAPHWTCDTLAAIWSPPLIADGRVYVCDEDGDVAIFYPFANPQAAAGRELKPARPGQLPAAEPAHEIVMKFSIYTLPTASKGVLFMATKNHLFAIKGPKK